MELLQREGLGACANGTVSCRMLVVDSKLVNLGRGLNEFVKIYFKKCVCELCGLHNLHRMVTLAPTNFAPAIVCREVVWCVVC